MGRCVPRRQPLDSRDNALSNMSAPIHANYSVTDRHAAAELPLGMFNNSARLEEAAEILLKIHLSHQRKLRDTIGTAANHCELPFALNGDLLIRQSRTCETGGKHAQAELAVAFQSPMKTIGPE